MENVLYQNFSVGYEKAKKEIYQELNSRIDAVVLNTMKEYLHKKNIKFNENISDLEEFKKNVVTTLDKQTQMDITNIENGLNKELSNLTRELKDGSTTAFRRFANGIGNISKSTVEMVARLTAIRTAYILSPTIGSIAMGASIISPKIIKTAKDIKNNIDETKRSSLDVMLIKLGTVKKDGKVEYDVSEENRKIITSSLQSEGINISSEDTIHFLQDISKLDNQTKEKVVNMLNNLKGNAYNIKEELDKTKINLAKIKKIIGDDIVSPLSTAALFGMTAGSALTETMPDLAPSIITAISSGALTGNIGIGALGGGAQYALSKFGNYIPIVGNAIEDVTKQVGAQETILATTGVAAIGILGFKIVPGLVYKGAKFTFNKMKNIIKARKEKKALKEKIAIEDVEKRIKDAKEKAENEMDSRKKDTILVDVVVNYIRSKGIQIPEEIKSGEELNVYVSKLTNDEKKEIYQVVKMLENISEENTKSVKKSLAKVAKTAYWGGILALAGLGVYDAFLNPGFIEGLADQKKFQKEISNSSEIGEISNTNINNLAKRKMENDLEKAKEQVQESVDRFRSILPESKDDYSNLMVEQPGGISAFWGAKDRNELNNKAVELFRINTEKGLNNLLHSLDPNSEELQELMRKLNVNSIDELAKSYKLQASINLVGGGNWYIPDLKTYDGPPFQYGDFTSLGDRKIGNTLIRLINSDYASKVSEIPLKNASEEEITKYIQELVTDRSRADSLAIYLGTKGENFSTLDYITESLDDYSSGLKEIEGLTEKFQSYNGLNMSEVSSGTQKVSELSVDYQNAMDKINEIENKAEGYFDGISSKLTNDPFEIAKTGATVGAGLQMVKQSGNIFSQIRKFFASKFSRKNKKTWNDNAGKETQEKINKLDNIIVKKENLKNTEKKERSKGKFDSTERDI